MKSFVKPAVIAGFGLACVALTTDAQTPLPAPAPTPPPPPGVVVTQAAPASPFYRAATVVAGDRLAFVYGEDGKELELARKIADPKTEDKAKVRDQLKELLNKHFDDRQKRHEKEIEHLEAQVRKLKEMVSKRQENKNEIVEERQKQLMREAQGLGW